MPTVGFVECTRGDDESQEEPVKNLAKRISIMRALLRRNIRCRSIGAPAAVVGSRSVTSSSSGSVSGPGVESTLQARGSGIEEDAWTFLAGAPALSSVFSASFVSGCFSDRAACEPGVVAFERSDQCKLPLVRRTGRLNNEPFAKDGASGPLGWSD